MISTIHSAQIVESNNIDRKTKKRIKKPISIIDYNKYMKGVDRADQYLSYYNILRRTKKWTKRVVLYLINCALFNAFCVWKKLNTTKMTYKKFRHEVALIWLSGQNSNNLESDTEEPGSSNLQQTTKRANKFDHPLRLNMDFTKHQLEKIVGTGKKRHPQRRCRVCTAHKKRSETSFVCKLCLVPLHKGSCFQRYHTLVKY